MCYGRALTGGSIGFGGAGSPVLYLVVEMSDLGTSGSIGNHNRTAEAVAGSELPIIRTTLGALAMPFRYLPELVRFGAIVFALSLASEIVTHYLMPLARVRYWWMMLSHVAIYTPFAIIWTRIAVLGRQSVSTIPRYRYSAVEIWYLVASALAFIILLGPVLVMLGYFTAARQNGDVAMANGIAFAAVAILFVDLIVIVRLSFLFPAIALQRYRGLATAWRQTRGYFERLCAIEVAVILPYEAIRLLYQHYWYIWFFSYVTWISEMLFHVVGGVLIVLDYAAIIAAPSLAYKFLIHESPGRSDT